MEAKKYFGQNFITDKNLINKIISTLGNEKEVFVVEIGPGKGALTKQMINKFQKVLAIEVDKDLEQFFLDDLSKDNFKIIWEDFLELDIKKNIAEENKNNLPVLVISNLPYYITSEILFKIFDNSNVFLKAVFMMQKEVAERITASVNSHNYNNLTVVANYFSKVKYEFTVNRKLFNPIPKVDSAIVSFDFSDGHSLDANFNDKFITIVRKLFNNKRKTILNNMTNLNLDKKKSENILKNISINPQTRPQNISLDNFILLVKEIIKNES